MQTKKLQRWRLTHLLSLLTKRYWYLRISREINPGIGVILYNQDLSQKPHEEDIIEGLIGRSATLSRQ